MPVIWGLAILMAIVEGVLYLGDIGLGPVGHRMAFAYGAFWSPLLGDVVPLYQGQKYVMFLSHAFLHGGLLHLAMNVTILLSLGRLGVLAVGERRTLILFFLSVLAGAVAFVFLGPSDPVPMVGASGGLFGLIAAWKRWEWDMVRARGLSLTPQYRFLLGFLAINIALVIFMPSIAWEAHLGGFVLGWLLAPTLRR
ncbi:membrane associated rhomboid family serine protease [Rubricella aquisinus]|uniref:Membrane associated rhomboid family serine protease n=1 Tax=Rubricella aquisinus TaxID=2028108 RepID=A0A840WPB5_9RHOB|nr:rhomboid family intramembrane serine protease [Rubricella aquisinus]MBB5516889.1 membrane associated rhomboid family serine protease [Rubricella aquisinus]